MMPFGLSDLHEQLVISGSSRSRALRQRLKRDVVAVTIDDERRDQIAFAVHADGTRWRRCRARRETQMACSSRDRQKRAIDRHIVARQNPQRDLRSIAVERASQKPAVRSGDADDRAGSARPSATSPRYTQKWPL